MQPTTNPTPSNPRPTTSPTASNASTTNSLTATFVNVELDDQPGQLGRAARILATANINVEGFVVGSEGHRFLVSNPKQAVDAFTKAGLECDTVDLFAIRVPNSPGQLAKIGEELGKANVNIVNCFGLAGTRENGRIFIECDNAETAKPILERFATVQTTPTVGGR